MARNDRKGAAGAHWLIGFHAVESALENDADRITELVFENGNTNPRLRKLQSEVSGTGVATRYTSRSELDQVSGRSRHQGVAARYKAPDTLTEKAMIERLLALDAPALLLVADGVQDPHNLGAILRTCDAAGAHGVMVPKDRAAGLSPTVCKVASGAAETMPLAQVTNLARALDQLKSAGLWVIGTSDQAEQSIFDVDLTGPIALVVGQEGAGMRRLTGERCDQLVKLPMAGTVSSLNVSVATGICLFEAVRQRAAKPSEV